MINKKILLTLAFILLSSTAYAQCFSFNKPIKPFAYCSGSWVAMCQNSEWQWVCLDY